MSDFKNSTARLIESKVKQAILNETSKILDHRFQTRVKDMELYARIFYTSILSSYTRASSFGGRVGIILPELELITKALYDMSRTKANKQGSFDSSKAFEVASTLRIKYKIPMMMTNNKLTYKMTFVINHPLLIALEHGDVSWEGMEKNKIIAILKASLKTLTKKKKKGTVTEEISSSSANVIKKAIVELRGGRFKLVKNKRPYLEIAVKNLIREKDFIGILIN